MFYLVCKDVYRPDPDSSNRENHEFPFNAGLLRPFNSKASQIDFVS